MSSAVSIFSPGFFFLWQHISFLSSPSSITMESLTGLLFLLVLLQGYVSALESLVPKFSFPSIGVAKGPQISKKARQVEDQLLAVIQDEGNRLANSERINELVTELESMPSQSIPEPAIAPQVYGRWRLLYTTNADTSSPIQRKAVDSEAFPIYQDIVVNEKGQLLVNQVVKFSDTAELCVSALASTSAYPLAELTNRKSTGKVLGLNILGVSLVGEEALPDPDRPNSRIDFVFDEGQFDFGSFKLPYPVPFRNPLFRDWVKGWIDITWLSDRLRISKGNKGTTFVLVKED